METSGTTRALELMSRVSSLIDELVTVDLNLSDEPDALAEAAKAGPNTVAILDRTKSLLIEIDDHYEQQCPDINRDEPEDDEEAIGPAQEICDMVFVCLNEIRQCRRRLVRAIQSNNPIRVVATSGEAFRRLNSALVPIESAVAQIAGKEPPARMGWDLEISLSVRKIYADLRSELQLVHNPDDDQIRESSIGFVLLFDDIKERDIYRFIRFDDRIHLDALLNRMRSWIREGPEADPEVGRNLWRELVRLVELMRQISIRTELKEHDQKLLIHTCHELYEADPKPESFPPYLRDELANLLGLDDELDWLIRNAGTHPPKFWEHRLLHMRDKLRSS